MFEEERGCHWIVGVVRGGRLWDGEEVFMCESFSTLTLSLYFRYTLEVTGCGVRRSDVHCIAEASSTVRASGRWTCVGFVDAVIG
mgnify:CR=1 FL=1